MKLVGALVLAVVLSACGADQDPGLVVEPSGPSTTSDTIPPCPQQSPAGCVDESGAVVPPT